MCEQQSLDCGLGLDCRSHSLGHGFANDGPDYKGPFTYYIATLQQKYDPLSLHPSL